MWVYVRVWACVCVCACVRACVYVCICEFVCVGGTLSKKVPFFPLSCKPLKFVDEFIYLGSNILSTEMDVNIHQAKAVNSIDRLSIIWKSDLSGKRKLDFFQTLAVFIQLYGCTI